MTLYAVFDNVEPHMQTAPGPWPIVMLGVFSTRELADRELARSAGCGGKHAWVQEVALDTPVRETILETEYGP